MIQIQNWRKGGDETTTINAVEKTIHCKCGSKYEKMEKI